jgi:hypothetical protein
MVRSVAVLVCCACLGSACVDDSSTSTTVYAPTLLTVDPALFLGNVRCGSELRKYVVTLYDVTETQASLGSAPPTECTKPVTFGTGKITAGHAYTVAIDGYDRDDIVPEGASDSGSRFMVDPTTLVRVPPRWTTTCGEPLPVIPDGEAPDADAQINPLRYPTIPLQNIEVTVHGCFPFRVAEGPDAAVDDAPADGLPDAAPADGPVEAPEDASGPDAAE